eukprot:403341622
MKTSPKALSNLQEIFLDPITRLQTFVFIFDALVAVYFIYHWSFWDKIKNKFVYFQYEARVAEKSDCSNLFLSMLFIILSKGVALGTLIAVFTLTVTEIDKINNEYKNEKQDMDVLQILRGEAKNAYYAKILNTILMILLVLSFIINLVTLNIPLINRKHSNLHEEFEKQAQKDKQIKNRQQNYGIQDDADHDEFEHKNSQITASGQRKSIKKAKNN